LLRDDGPFVGGNQQRSSQDPDEQYHAERCDHELVDQRRRKRGGASSSAANGGYVKPNLPNIDARYGSLPCKIRSAAPR
jgi:hypothetical protein